MIELSSLPPEVRALIEAQAATIARQDAELLVQRDTIAKMRLQLDRLRRMQFGRSSEKIAAEIAQLTLALEELEANPETHVDKAAKQPASAAKDDHQKPARRPFPDHLPRGPAAQILLPRLREHRPSRRAGAADPPRPGDRWPAGACPRREIRRSPAALSAERDLCA